ncbi:MAG: hypothetical protein IT443_07325 [Phycisphaeraceae bacterium]|nr:hypothetical protein [Phycisphaeraceae bacterium]
MRQSIFLELAAQGARLPIGTDMVLREQPQPEAVAEDGQQLGQVVVAAARRYRSPLAIPLMDLTLEKAWILAMLGIAPQERETYQFHQPPGPQALETIRKKLADPLPTRSQATFDAVAYVAGQTDLTPLGMAIGPFSLLTKMMPDPISAIYMAGMGAGPDDEVEVKTALELRTIALEVVLASLQRQIAAGAKAIIVCEPAANITFFSPNQLQAGSDVFERFVMQPARQIKQLLDQHGVQLFLHDCGELMDPMVTQLASLQPAVLSLGSSRRLWEDAQLVPKDVVLFGNLPSKQFYSDELTPPENVQGLIRELTARMRQTGHPFILGSECDVLSVEGCHEKIKGKVELMLNGKAPFQPLHTG